ncbi:hypothetical protein ACHAWX_003577 [Stephanocyclus meneghinianus]
MDQSIHRRTIPKCILIGILIVSSSAFNAVDTVRHFSRHYSTALFYKDSADVYKDSITDQKTSKVSDFKLRMRSIVKQRQSTGRKSTSAWRPQNFKTAISLQEYFNVIEEGRRSKRTVVVKFHATWCKKCQSLRPVFLKMATSNPEMIFLDVPVTESNANLHKGLGIESVPFAHVYHPERGLVEETKLSRETFSDFIELVEKHSS